LHMVQLMPLPSQNPIISCLIYSRLVLPFWYLLTHVVLEKRPLNRSSSSKFQMLVTANVVYELPELVKTVLKWYTE